MYKQKLLLCVILIGVSIISISCLEQNLKQEDDINEKEIVPVEIQLSTTKTIYNERIFSGKVFPKEQSVVISKIQGEVKSINVEIGDEVNKGDILFTVSGINPNLSQTTALGSNLIIQGVKAPIDGIVSNINITKGQILLPSEPPMLIVNLNDIYVQIGVAGDVINKLTKNQEARVIIDSVSEDAVEGKIVKISPVPDLRTQLYSITVEIKNKDKLIKPGMLAQVIIKTDVMENVIVIPSDTVFYRDDIAYVYVVNEGTALEREIEIGLDTGEMINVIKGLDKGEPVVTKGHNFIDDGTKVEVVGGDE